MPRQQHDERADLDPKVVVAQRWPDPEEGPWKADLTFAVRNGRVQCVGVELGHVRAEQALTQDVVRRMPLARLIEHVRKDPPQALTRLVLPGPFYRLSDMAEHNLGLLAPPEIPAQLDEGFFRRVAAVYQRSPSKPTTAVAEHFGVSQTRAANWVRRARMKGLIPSAKSSSQHSEES